MCKLIRFINQGIKYFFIIDGHCASLAKIWFLFHRLYLLSFKYFSRYCFVLAFSFLLLLSICCPVILHLLSTYSLDNNWTTTGQQLDNKRTTVDRSPLENRLFPYFRKINYFNCSHLKIGPIRGVNVLRTLSGGEEGILNYIFIHFVLH